ncbi:MAG TPA: hypothetical protein P5137_10630 [Candidatus Brocadiia bacterium]|nr:hypothetical protein [Candidatus Brocadiia bacterium]
MRRWVWVAVVALCGAALAGKAAPKTVFECSFARGKWDAGQWTLAKSPRWDYFGQWEQKDDCIQNATPAGAAPKDLLGKRAAETYTSMVLKEKLKGNVTLSSTMEFTDRMAPLIVLAPELGADAQGRPEYRQHYEIVIYDQGVNVWRHDYADGKPFWRKMAWGKFELKPNQKYRLVVKLAQTARGKTLTAMVDGHEVGYLDDGLPDEFYAGVTGCEGVNRFYDFRVER